MNDTMQVPALLVIEAIAEHIDTPTGRIGSSYAVLEAIILGVVVDDEGTPQYV